MKLLRYLAINSAFAYSIYAGVYGGSVGFANIAKFVIITVFVISLLCLSDSVRQKMALQPYAGRTVPKSFDLTFTAILVVALVYAGWMWYGAMLFVAELFMHDATDAAAKIRDKEELY